MKAKQEKKIRKLIRKALVGQFDKTLRKNLENADVATMAKTFGVDPEDLPKKVKLESVDTRSEVNFSEDDYSAFVRISKRA